MTPKDEWFITRDETYKWVEDLKKNKIMDKKEKAQELFKEYYSYLKANLMNDEEAWEDAKVCALMAIDQIIEALDINQWQNLKVIEYYKEVKQEIEWL
jgi:hypothetical protein